MGTITRIDFNKVPYARLATHILKSKVLSSDAKVLLQLCLNNQKGWKIRVDVYAKELGWGTNKKRSAVKDLIQQGYIARRRIMSPNGQIDWDYDVSELGDLKDESVEAEQSMPTVEVEKVEASTPQPELSTTIVEDLIPMVEEEIPNPAPSDLKFLDDCIKFLNNHGCESAKRRIKDQVKEMFLKRFRRYSEDEFVWKVKDIYDAVAPYIIREEGRKTKFNVQYFD